MTRVDDKENLLVLPVPLGNGLDGFIDRAHLRRFINWEAKKWTGLSAAKLLKGMKSGEYENSPLWAEFSMFRVILDEFSMPDEDTVSKNPQLRTGLKRKA